MKKVAIIGPGLLGGSIGLSLRVAGGTHVAMWGRREESVRETICLGPADAGSVDFKSVVSGADLVVMCTPVGTMEELARQMVPWLKPGVLVTDVGSVKSGVVEKLETVFEGSARFVGSHPMAGSEQSGVGAARKDLFQGALCILTPTAKSDPQVTGEIAAFWHGLGCHTREMAAPEHDRAMALISHFPHLLAASLVEMVFDQDPSALELCGPGFRDSTRIAGGPSRMWAEILGSNRAEVKKSAEAMIEKLRETIRLLDSGSPEIVMQEFLTKAKAHRERVRQTR